MKNNFFARSSKFRKFSLGVSAFSLALVPIAAVTSCSKIVIDNQGLGDVSAEDRKIINDVAMNIRGQGSSSVLPIINEIQSALADKDFQYEGTGSGDGLKVGTGEIANKDFGMTSSLKNPNASQAQYWIDHKIRTVTFAVDAIGIALNLPSGLKNALGNERPVIDGNELGKLYALNPENVTWAQLLENTQADSYNQPIFAMGRIGGKQSSGTSDGFFSKMVEVSGMSESELDLNHTKLGADHLTAEANAAAKQAIETKENALGYLSLGYAIKNESDHLTLATVHTAKNNEMWVPEMENVTSKDNHPAEYGWTRPFNVIYSTQNAKAVSFVKLLLSDANQKSVELKNFIKLDKTNAQVQEQNNNLLTPDSELAGVSDVTKDVLGLTI